MTVTLARGPLSARFLLLGADARQEQAVMTTLLEGVSPFDGSDAIGRLSHAARQAVRQDVTAAAARLLDLDVADVLIAGWCKHRELRAAAHRTRAAPGTSETVCLAAHRITHRSQPYVNILLDQQTLARFTLTLRVMIEIVGLEGSIRLGRLIALHAGQASASAQLSWRALPIISPTVRLPLAAELSLGDGINLIA